MRKIRKTVFVAMSGGVDSSVAALLLKKQGYDIVGVFMKCWSGETNCTAHADATDARRVAEKLKIPFYVWDFEEEYKKRVVDYMVSGYREGITPNPDVMCNKEIKFGLFLKKALSMGADYIVTGHYARLRNTKNPALGGVFVEPQNDPRWSRLTLKKSIADDHKMSRVRSVDKLKGRGPSGNRTPEVQVSTLTPDHPGPTAYSLYQARDKTKDQSYFLWTLTQEQLKHCLFPIGDYLKSEVRELARQADLPTAEKKDSQGICFLGKVTLEEFLGNYIPEKPGAVLNTADQKIGEHKGVQFYTIGQRHGLNHETWNMKQAISTKGNRSPFYVAEKDAKANTLKVVQGSDHPELYRKEIEICEVNFMNPDAIKMLHASCLMLHVLARVRYRQPLAPGKLMKLKANSYKLTFDSPVKFVAPGQSAVLYSEEGELLGGGVIVVL